MPFSGWINWVLRAHSGANAPTEWQNINQELHLVDLSDRNISKIELAAFAKKGRRVVRWSLGNTDPEYCTRADAVKVAKKLTWLMLLSRNAPTMTQNLKHILACSETNGCKLFEGHEQRCVTSGGYYSETTRCQLCGKIIDMQDFDRDGRRDPVSIQIGHHVPLSRRPRQHFAGNVAWAHRSCNFIQGDQTLDEVVRNMITVLERNGYTVERTNP